MENRKTSKDFSVGEKNYRIEKMDARSSCWLFSFMGARAEGGKILSALGHCNRAEFDEIQTMVLKKVFRIDTEGPSEFPIAVLSPNGSFSDPLIATDPEIVMSLTVESILWQLAPFLTENGSNSPQ